MTDSSLPSNASSSAPPTEVRSSPFPDGTDGATPGGAPLLRLWFPLLLVAAFWGAWFLLGAIEIPMFRAFLLRLLAVLILMLGFSIWWLTRRTISRGERFGVLGAVLAAAVVSIAASHRSVVAPTVLMFIVPATFTLWPLWLWGTRRSTPAWRRGGLLLLLPLLWLPALLIRMEGLSGDGQAVLRWRWTPTAEERRLAAHADTAPTPTAAAATDAAPSAKTETPAEPLVLTAGDWPQFRGPEGDGVVHGTRIARDWKSSPPKLLWEREIGPAWSSVVVIGDRLFTQEQRGDQEAVLCLDAATGREIWSQTDPARFDENLSGIGPRATPAFADGRLFTVGATGLLNAYDAATGTKLWSRDIRQEAGAELPMWGFSGSPVVAGDAVVAFAGGKSEKTLLAYSARSGEPLWTAPAGDHSYASPQVVQSEGTALVLFVGDTGLTAVDPASGTPLWRHAGPEGQVQPSLQAHPLANSQLLVSFGPDFGTSLLDLKFDQKTDATSSESKTLPAPAVRWTSKDLKPFFNDFVLYEGAIYGFDGNLFGCVDLATGKRRWKKGRYGNGQVLLLADQGLLLVQSESGEIVLLAANPERLEELGRIPALTGNTWNHPVLARGRLYVRNAEQMEAFELPTADGA